MNDHRRGQVGAILVHQSSSPAGARVFDFEPIYAPAGAAGRSRPLRHDALESYAAGVRNIAGPLSPSMCSEFAFGKARAEVI
jgi:hypothetical protein